MKQLHNNLRILLLGVFVGWTLNEALRQYRTHQEAQAFWNSPFMREQRTEHEARLRNDPAYRMRVAEAEAIHGSP